MPPGAQQTAGGRSGRTAAEDNGIEERALGHGNRRQSSRRRERNPALFARSGSAFQRDTNVGLHDVADEILTGLTHLRVVGLAVGDVVRHHADAEKRDLETGRRSAPTTRLPSLRRWCRTDRGIAGCDRARCSRRRSIRSRRRRRAPSCTGRGRSRAAASRPSSPGKRRIVRAFGSCPALPSERIRSSGLHSATSLPVAARRDSRS